MSRSLRVATLTVLIGGWAFSTPAASARTGTKIVRYHGLRLVLPASWPVFNLSAHPAVCVRFNRHAVYLGIPGAAQRCPAHSIGRTESLLVSPLTGRTARAAGTGDPLPGAGSRTAQPSHGSSARIVVRSRRVVVTATWRAHVGVIERALRTDRLTATR